MMVQRHNRKHRARRMRWGVLAGVGCLVLAGCAGSDEQAEPDETPAVSVAVAPEDDDGLESLRRRPHLECLPLAESGWSRAEEIVGVVGFPAALAANDEAVVVGGSRELNGDVVVYRSPDGLDWEEGEGFPLVNDGGPGVYVAGGPQGFVFAATRNGAVPNTPVVAFSVDGVSWEHIDPGALPEDQVAWLSGVFAGPDSFIIVGSRLGNDLLMWHSTDGRTWTDTDLPPLEVGQAAVAPTDTGWISLTVTDQVQVWTSPNGLQWSETDTQSAPPDDVLRAYTGTTPLTVHDGNWVLAVGGAERGDPTVWVSTDEGANWNEHAIWGDDETSGFQIAAIASTEFGLIVAGAHDRADEHGLSFLHYSQDGMSWTPCLTTPLAFTQLVAFGEGVAAYDSEFGDIYTWTET